MGNLTKRIAILKYYYRGMQAGLFTVDEFFLMLLNFVIGRAKRNENNLAFQKKANRLKRTYFKNGIFIFKNARLPSLTLQEEYHFLNLVFEDIYHAYLLYDDDYTEKTLAKFYDCLPEGTYCFKNEHVDVQVERGDIVFDVGSWIGDFAAYASAKKAIVYAFEPSAKYDVLLRTAELNENIFPVKMGLSDVSSRASIDEVALSFRPSKNKDNLVEITTIDEFIGKNQIEHVDFIKADIEGHERYLLSGARNTLRYFAPKLAICTYHLPDDPEVLASLIKEANPYYNIVQKQKKLYASVPK